MITVSHNWPSRGFPFFKFSKRRSLFFPWHVYPILFSRILSRRFLPLRDKVNVNGFFAAANPTIFSLCLCKVSLLASSCFVAVVVSPLPGFQDYDENLTSAKVVPIRQISHFSGTARRTRFSALPTWNSRGRMALKSFSRHPFRGWSRRVKFTRKLNKKRKGFFKYCFSYRG